MMKMNFELVAVDALLRGPGNWDAGTRGCHDHQVAIVPALQKSDVAVMRQNFWPQVQVGCCIENRRFRRMHDNGIGFVHENVASLDGNPHSRRCCASSAEQATLSPKSISVKVKNRSVKLGKMCR